MSAKYKPSEYEVLRRRCVELKESGWKQKDIASVFGLTEGWVSQTLKKYRESGPEGLLTRKPPGSLVVLGLPKGDSVPKINSRLHRPRRPNTKIQ